MDNISNTHTTHTTYETVSEQPVRTALSKPDSVRILLQNKDLTVAQIAAALGVRKQYVYQVRHYDRKANNLKHRTRNKAVRIEKAPTKPTPDTSPNMDAINSMVHSPAHYTDGGISTLDYIEAKKLSYLLGNVVKYVSRAGKKAGTTELEDLMEASVYLDERIRQITKGIK